MSNEFYATLFGGWFGLHKYMKKQIGMGLLYTFTFGLFCIGWIVDIIRAAKTSKTQNIPPLEYLPVVNVQGIILKQGEICHYFGNAEILKTKNIVTGHKSSGGGISFQVAKGVRLSTGSGKSQAIRSNVTEKYKAKFYVTSERIIAVASKGGFDKKISNLSGLTNYSNGFDFQFGSQTFEILAKDAPYINQIIRGVINGLPVSN